MASTAVESSAAACKLENVATVLKLVDAAPTSATTGSKVAVATPRTLGADELMAACSAMVKAALESVVSVVMLYVTESDAACTGVSMMNEPRAAVLTAVCNALNVVTSANTLDTVTREEFATAAPNMTLIGVLVRGSPGMVVNQVVVAGTPPTAANADRIARTQLGCMVVP